MTGQWDRYALLLIDVQEDFYSPALAQLRNGYAERVAGLLEFCRAAGIAVVHAHAQFAADGSDWMGRYLLRGTIPCIENTAGARVCDFAAPVAGEKVLVKHSFDAFLGTDLDKWLRAHGIDVLFVAGLVTSTCVLFSAASATQRSYLVAVVEDCCGDDPPRHDEVLAAYPFVFDRVCAADLAQGRARWDEQRAVLTRWPTARQA